MIIGKYYKRIGYAKEDPPLRVFPSSVTNAKFGICHTKYQKMPPMRCSKCYNIWHT